MSVKVEPSKLIQVAVLGSGIVGLITAIELLKKGHRVVIYSENFPKFGEENPNKRLSSQMKAHVWYPAYYDN